MNIPLITGGVLMKHIKLACSNKIKGAGGQTINQLISNCFLFFHKLVEFEANQQTTNKNRKKCMNTGANFIFSI